MLRHLIPKEMPYAISYPRLNLMKNMFLKEASVVTSASYQYCGGANTMYTRRTWTKLDISKMCFIFRWYCHKISYEQTWDLAALCVGLFPACSDNINHHHSLWNYNYKKRRVIAIMKYLYFFDNYWVGKDDLWKSSIYNKSILNGNKIWSLVI